MNTPVLELRRLSKTFHQPGAPPLRAVDDVSLHVNRAECIALVGESGSGKSTLARMALQLIGADSGDALLQGHSLAALSPAELRTARLSMQPVFQDPAASFNPRRTVAAILRQALNQLGSRVAGDEQLVALLDRVELRPAHDFLGRYPHELSGGQRQRLAIARAICTRPVVIIADEPLSGADVSIRAQILNLLIDLQRDTGVAYVLITHDMLVARAFSDRVAVMYRGRIVEEGPTADVLSAPRHPYTQSLIAAVQSLDGPWEASPPLRTEGLELPGDGCAFLARCPKSGQRCVHDAPYLREVGSGHRASCHFPTVQKGVATPC